MPSLSNLEARVKRILVDVPTDTSLDLRTLMQESQAEIEEAHNWRHMHEELTATTSNLTRTLVAKPALWFRALGDPYWYDGDGITTQLKWIGYPDALTRGYNSFWTTDGGTPKHLRETESNIEVYPLPDTNSPTGAVYSDGDYRIVIPYLKREALLDTDASENWWTTNAVEYMVAATAAEAFIMNRDREEAFVWSAKAREEKRMLIRNDKKSRLPSSFILRVGRDSARPITRPRGF